jgi:A/G-specific adenine glycosylase
MHSTRSVSEIQRAGDPSAADVMAIRKAIVRWGRTHGAQYPWRNDGVPLWQKLVAEVMLVRTKADQVAPIWESFVSKYATPSSLSRVSLEEVRDMVAPLGLEWRAVLLHRLLRAVAASDGDVPTTSEELKRLPGVGDYCAAAFLSLHAGQHATVVDSNVVRLISRALGRSYDGETRRKAWLLHVAERLTPARSHTEYNYAVLDLAMTVCTPRPHCLECPLAKRCQWRIASASA